MPKRALIIGGLPGTGSTTVARLLAQHLGVEHVYGGGIFRAMAKEAGQPLEQYMADLAARPERERAVDERLLARLAEGEVVLESRILAWLAPADPAVPKIWLTCDPAERVRRLEQREPTGDVRERAQAREATDAARYAGLYGIDLTDHRVFDQVIDTTKVPAATVAERIMAKLGD